MAKHGPHVERLLAVAANRRLVAFGGWRDTPGVSLSRVHVVSAGKGTPRAALPVEGAVHALAFLADDLLVAATSAGRLIAWDAGAETPEPKIDEALGTARLRALATDPMGRLLAVAGEDGTLHVLRLEVESGRPRLIPVGTRRLSTRPLLTVALDAAGTTVAIGGEDGVVRTLAVASVVPGANEPSAPVREMPCGEGGVRALALTDDGRLIAGCGDGSIRIGYLEGDVDLQNRSADNAHAAAVRALLLGPQTLDEAGREQPRRLFSAGEDGTVKSWLLDSRRKPRTVEIPGGPLTALALIPPPASREGEGAGRLVIGSQGRRLVQVELGKEAELADSLDVTDSELDRLDEVLTAAGVKLQVRVAAVHSLQALGEDEARVLLERALQSDSGGPVRAAAAEAIEASGRRASRPALRKALEDSEVKVRQAAFKALLTLEKDAPVPALRAALACSHDDVRLQAVDALPAHAAASPLVPGLLADHLADGSAEVRRHALDALTSVDPSIEPLRVALDRGPADVRSEALVRLGFARKDVEIEARELIHARLGDSEAQPRNTAFVVAVGIEPRLAARLRAVVPPLGKSLDELSQRFPRAAVTEDTQVVLGEPELVPLFAAMSSRSPDIALFGAWCLALVGDARSVGALLQLSREPDPALRGQAAAALLPAALAFEDSRVVTRLGWLLDDQDANVRSVAFEALTRLAHQRGTVAKLELIETALRAGQEDVRVRALQLLVQLGAATDPALAARADALLGDALDDEAAVVRGEAYRTLWAWHTGSPEIPLERATRCRHADIRRLVVGELEHRMEGKARFAKAPALLLQLVRDTSAEVGLAAYAALTGKAKDDAAARKKIDPAVHLAALGSPRPEVRAEGARGAVDAPADAVRARLTDLIDEPYPAVHLAAIEAIDKLVPSDQEAFSRAFNSELYELNVRAAELCGRRRDRRAVEPMKRLLSIPKLSINRPTDALRQRAAAALSDVGDPAVIPFYVSLLDDEDPVVREMGARGLATACGPGNEQPLVDALAHPELAVRSWAAEGLAKLGDVRALPVLAGTQRHEHRPIRVGAILGFVALGPDGVRGLRQGLEDPDREIQDLVFAVIVARDVALAEASLPPDLLTDTLSSSQPEIRFSGARLLEVRAAHEPLGPVVTELVGPRKPERAAEMQSWPAESRRQALLNVLVRALASDHPEQRYAAARVLSLRPQPESFWRASEALGRWDRGTWIPQTNWTDEKHQPRKQGWIRRLVAPSPKARAAEAGSGLERVVTILHFVGGPRPRPVPEAGGLDGLKQLVFGVYAGLVRQAPQAGAADETHRVRRDSVERLAVLGADPRIERSAVLPVLSQALSDPNHLVRLAAMNALRRLYPTGALEPLAQAIRSSAVDVGSAAVDELTGAALAGDPKAGALVRSAIDAPNGDVRQHALGRLPRLFPSGSMEPWLLALESRHADVRLAVVDRLLDSTDGRVTEALIRAMASDHADLRFKAAGALARRGDARCVDVLAGFLRTEDEAEAAVEALVELAHARPQAAEAQVAAGAAARALAGRLEDDPDRTADRAALIDALGRIGHHDADPVLLKVLCEEPASENPPVRAEALEALLAIARRKGERPQRFPDGTERQRYDEQTVLRYLTEAARCPDATMRGKACTILRDVDDVGAEVLLGRLVEDRDPAVRVAACEALAFRVEYVQGASLDAVDAALRGGRRELVLPAAFGLAARGRPEAFQALVLVLKAGEPPERERAAVALGRLGDRRALEYLLPLARPEPDADPTAQALVPAAAEALGWMLPRLTDEKERREVGELVEQLASSGQLPVRRRALTGLRHAGDEASRALIERTALDRSEPTDLRAHALSELGLQARPGSEAALAEALSDHAPAVRREAVKALTRVFQEDRTKVSLLALRSKHSDVSEPAAAFLAKNGDPAVLVRGLAEIEDREVRRRLRRGLIRRGASPANELESLLRGENAAARAEAAWIAGAAGDKALAPAIVRDLELSSTAFEKLWRESQASRWDQSGARGEQLQIQAEAWEAAMWASTQVGAESRPLARQAATSSLAPAAVRREAVRFLGRWGTSADADVLRDALSDRDPETRAAAAAAIAAVAPQRSAGLLAEVAVADSAAVAPLVNAALPASGASLFSSGEGRSLALPVLIGQKRTEELLAIALAPSKDPARVTAIEALGRIGGERARQGLEQILANKGEEAPVRAAAFKALRRLMRAAEVSYTEGQDKERRGSMTFAAGQEDEEPAEEEEDEDDEEEGEDEEGEDDDEAEEEEDEDDE